MPPTQETKVCEIIEGVDTYRLLIQEIAEKLETVDLVNPCEAYKKRQAVSIIKRSMLMLDNAIKELELITS